MTTREQMWRRVYEYSRAEYTRIPGYDDRDAAATADAACGSWFARSGLIFRNHRMRRLVGISKTPDPGNTLDLTPNGGHFVGVDVVDAQGRIHNFSFDRSDDVVLLWSADRKALFAFPNLERGACVYPPTPRENHLSKVWAKGRPAKCSSKARYPAPALRWVLPAIQTSYRSDKFGKVGQMQDYIHHHEANVMCYCSSNPNRRKAPDVMMIRGGRLRLTSHGIDG